MYEIKKANDVDALYGFFEKNKLEISDGPSATKPLTGWQIDDKSEIIAGIMLGSCDGEFILDGIAVTESLRREKIGEKLLNTLLEEAKKRGAERLLLVAKVPEFFRVNGFETIADPTSVPQFFSCLSCPQYRKTCFPEIMSKKIADKKQL